MKHVWYTLLRISPYRLVNLTIPLLQAVFKRGGFLHDPIFLVYVEKDI